MTLLLNCRLHWRKKIWQIVQNAKSTCLTSDFLCSGISVHHVAGRRNNLPETFADDNAEGNGNIPFWKSFVWSWAASRRHWRRGHVFFISKLSSTSSSSQVWGRWNRARGQSGGSRTKYDSRGSLYQESVLACIIASRWEVFKTASSDKQHFLAFVLTGLLVL